MMNLHVPITSTIFDWSARVTDGHTDEAWLLASQFRQSSA